MLLLVDLLILSYTGSFHFMLGDGYSLFFLEKAIKTTTLLR